MRTVKQQEQTREIVNTAKEFSEFSQVCKDMAKSRRARSPVQVEKTPQVIENICRYIEEQKRNNRPLTHAGFMRCFGVGSDVYYKLEDYDHVIEEYKAIHDLPLDATEHQTERGTIPLVAWSTIKKNVCDVAIQEQLEENCYTNRGNPAGSIFGLKARYDWTEDGNRAQTVNNNLIIADTEQAKNALKMLTSE